MHSLFFVKKNTKSNNFILLQVVLLAVTVLVQAKAFTPLSFSKHIRNIHRANTNSNSSNSISSLHLSQSTSASTMSSESKTTNEELSEYPSNWRRFPSDYENNNKNKNKPSSSPSPFQRNNSDNINDITWSKEVYKKSLQKYNEYMSSQDSFIAPYIKEALDTLLHAYRLYGPENVIGSFNGGKDAVVIMEVMRAAHAKYYHDLLSSSSSEGSESDNGSIDIDYDTSSIIKPRVIYFYHNLEFPQVYDFVRNTVQNYDLDMIAFEQDISFVQGLGILVERNTKTISNDNNDNDNENNNVESHKIPMAFVLGTRSTDPNAGNQGLFAPSSTWMPPFMRVNPILNWTYGHTWHFLRLFQIPYCTLYDEGYTSLGNIDNTLPCPALLKVKVASDSANGNSIGDNTGSESDDVDDNDSCTHWPAYMLKDWDQERAGRIKKEKKKETKSKSTDDTVSTTTKVVVTTTAATENETSNDTNEKESTGSKDNSNNEDDVSSISSATTTAQRSVGLLVIGDEILKGLTPDTNTHYAATALKSNNVPLTKVSVVSDDLEEIVREIEYMSTLVDIIITSGGVGP
jgi:FAD synthetase